MALANDFNAKYNEAMTLVKKYIDCQDSKKQAQIDKIKEQLEAIKQAEGESGNLTLLNKLNDIISFLTNDIVNITRNIFTIDCEESQNGGGNGDNGGNGGDNGNGDGVEAPPNM